MLPALQSLRRRARRTAAPLLLAMLLAGCGGGISIGFDWGDPWDDGRAPSVSLAVSPDTVRAGQPVRLVAAASDADGIEQVAFFRIENGGSVLLFADGQAPYEFDTLTPTDGRSSVRYFARATDHTGRRSDSVAATVTLLP